MFKFFAAFRKEWFILIRDWAGLIVLFLMPMIMVVILSLVQEFGWNVISKEPTVEVLYVNEDNDSLSSLIEDGIHKAKTFKLITEVDHKKIDQARARELVRTGADQIGLVIPKGATHAIERKVQVLVTRIVSGIMMPMKNPFLDIEDKDSVNIIVFFDPAIKGTFKNTFMSSMKEFSLKIESGMIFNDFNSELHKMFPQFATKNQDYKETVFFKEVYPSGKTTEVYPTPTQHNVPSWAIFAMFFIVIPLTSSIIKEREEGSMIRLHTLPVNYITIFMAKVGVYMVVCFIQFILMILAGIFVLPMFGLPSLDISTNYFPLIIMALATSLSALGYGILVGTIARTHQQAAAFGSVSIVILAAMGGLWVPIYLMPAGMRSAAAFSPLNWAWSGFMDIFLRGGNIMEILPELTKLILFFVVMIGLAGLYRKFKPIIGS